MSNTSQEGLIYLVVAGNFRQFQYFMHQKEGITETRQREFRIGADRYIFIQSRERILGFDRRRTRYITTGEYWLNSVWPEVRNLYESGKI